MASIISTFLPIPAEAGNLLVRIGKFVIVMAMAAIGLNTNLAKFIQKGWKPILLGLSCWVALSVASLIVQYMVLKI
jgi:uncharacterized membrane protein YadS